MTTTSKAELVIVYLTQISMTFMPLWAYIFTYYSSYCFVYQKELRYTQMYSTVLFYYIGSTSSQFVYPYLFQIAGLKNMFLLLGITEFCMSLFAINFTTFPCACIVILFKGIVYQGVLSCDNVFLSCNYKNGILKSKYLLNFNMIFSYCWLAFLIVVVNPKFKQQNTTNEYGDQFFETEVAQRFQYFLYAYGTIALFVLILAFLFVKNPEQFQPRIIEYINYLRGKQEKFEFTDINDIVNRSTSEESLSVIDQVDNDKRESKEIELLDLNDKNHKDTENPQNMSKIDEDSNQLAVPSEKELQLILMICFVFLVNMNVAIYHVDSYRYIALVIGFSDKSVSFCYFLATISRFFSGQLVTYIWQKYGFKTNLKLVLYSQTITLVLIVISKQFFVFSIIIFYAQVSYFFILNDVFCYGLFHPVKAMIYLKYFMVAGLIGSFSQVLMNFLIFDQNFYKKIYIIQLGFTIVTILFYVVFIRPVRIEKRGKQ